MKAVNPALTWLDGLMVFLVLGYLALSQSFAHLGVAPVYVGELALAAFVLARPQPVLRGWLGALTRGGPLYHFSAWLYVFVGYGVIQCFRGLTTGPDPLVTLQNLVFNVYPVLFFAGVWAGWRCPDLLPKLLRGLAWWHGIYGTLFIVLLSPLGLALPREGGGVAWFGQPAGAAVALLGLLSFEANLGRMWLPVLLNTFVLIGVQVRAEWLGFLVCLALWGYLAGRLGQLVKVASFAVGLLLVGLVTDVSFPSPAQRGGEISTRRIIGRALSAVDTEAAATYNPKAEDHASTVTWRTGWWKEIWNMVHESPAWTLLGPGYGYPIWDLHPEYLNEQHLRTPHNVFMFALGYTGWLGVVLFYGLQLSLARLLWRVYRLTGQPFGLCYWAMIMVWAVFDNFFEAPFGAIPFFLLMGMAVGPLLMHQTSEVSETSEV